MRMQRFDLMTAVVLALTLFNGCGENKPAEKPTEKSACCSKTPSTQPSAPVTKPTEKPATAPAGPKTIDAPEIIRILENENINFIRTTHAQRIGIALKDGRVFRGTYDPKQAGKYADIKNVGFDILNLVIYIQKQRNQKWSIMCE